MGGTRGGNAAMRCVGSVFRALMKGLPRGGGLPGGRRLDFTFLLVLVFGLHGLCAVCSPGAAAGLGGGGTRGRAVTSSLLFAGRGEALQMRVRRLRQEVRQQQRQKEALPCPHQRQAVLLQDPRLRQVLHSPQLPAQAHEDPLQIASSLSASRPPGLRRAGAPRRPSAPRRRAPTRAAPRPRRRPVPSGHRPQRVVRLPGRGG